VTVFAYISLGNSDDKLTQRRWASFVRVVAHDASLIGKHVHGVWYSAPPSRYQNACIAVELEDDVAVLEDLRSMLREHARTYGQESIALALVEETEFIAPAPAAT
jgi:hypothetical protein